jgi:hypothetical protein
MQPKVDLQVLNSATELLIKKAAPSELGIPRQIPNQNSHINDTMLDIVNDVLPTYCMNAPSTSNESHSHKMWLG